MAVEQEMPMETIPFDVGKIYDRQRDIHSRFKGQQQGGISTPADCPFIILFTGETGEQYGTCGITWWLETCALSGLPTNV